MGINFYNWRMGTPFILREDVCGILKYFKTKEYVFLICIYVLKIQVDEHFSILEKDQSRFFILNFLSVWQDQI